jgi:hypothetical protein
MRPRWIPCTAVIPIKGRGVVRCWQPPRPGGDGRCAAHEGVPRLAVRRPTEAVPAEARAAWPQ